MLKTRVITAILLLAVLLPALFLAPATVWLLVAALILLAGAWEWGRLMSAPATSQWGFVVALGLLMGALVWGFPESLGITVTDSAQKTAQVFRPLYGLAAAFWCGVVPLWLKHKWRLDQGLLGWCVGALVLLPMWLALVQLRMLGTWFLLSVVAIAWVADIAAYFAGRKWGRIKLAPTISPGKTREGAVGAMVAVLVYGLVVSQMSDSVVPVGFLLLALIVLTAISIIGDLYESLLKRQADIKDSSQLLPGHGGVLDRIDSLTAVLPVAMALILAVFNP